MNLVQMYCQVLGIRIFVSQIHSRIILMRIAPIELSIAEQGGCFVFVYTNKAMVCTPIANVLPGFCR